MCRILSGVDATSDGVFCRSGLFNRRFEGTFGLLCQGRREYGYKAFSPYSHRTRRWRRHGPSKWRPLKLYHHELRPELEIICDWCGLVGWWFVHTTRTCRYDARTHTRAHTLQSSEHYIIVNENPTAVVFITDLVCPSFRKWGGGRRLDWSGSGQGQVAVSCKRGNEPLCFIKCGEFLD
jgi:hypothetical protein